MSTMGPITFFVRVKRQLQTLTGEEWSLDTRMRTDLHGRIESGSGYWTCSHGIRLDYAEVRALFDEGLGLAELLKLVDSKHPPELVSA